MGSKGYHLGCLLPLLLVVLFTVRGSLPFEFLPGGLPWGRVPMSGIATMSRDDPDVVYFTSDRDLRRSIAQRDRGGWISITGACLILSEAQWLQLHKLGGRAHLRGEATELALPANCPASHRSRRSDWVWAYRPIRIDAIEPVACDEQQYMRNGGRCDGPYTPSGHRQPAAVANPDLVDLFDYYPPELLPHRFSGKVTIGYQLGRDGVQSCRVRVSSGVTALDRAACEAIRREPALRVIPATFDDTMFQTTLAWDFPPAPVPLPLPLPPAAGKRLDLAAYYPAEVPDLPKGARVVVRYRLGPDGAGDCATEISSGYPALDAATCRAVLAEPDLRPAARLQTPQVIHQPIRWETPPR